MIQIVSLKGRDEDEFFNALKSTGKGRRFTVDCNGTLGLGCAIEDLDEVLAGLETHGYHRMSGKAGSPESRRTVFVR